MRDTSTQTDCILTAEWVLPISSPPIHRGAVHIVDGRIRWVGPASEPVHDRDAAARSSPERRDLGHAALLPGLVNVHSHLELTVLRGSCEEPDFAAWIRKLTGIKYGCLEREDLLASARWGALEMVRAGVTAVGDTSDQEVALPALLESGLRGISYQEVFGPDDRKWEESLRGLEESLERQLPRVTGRVGVGVSPHTPYTVSRVLYRKVAELAARRGLPLATHIAESRAERQLIAEGRGPFAEAWRERGLPVEGRGLSPVAFLESCGVLEVKPLLIHAIDVDPVDVERIARSGSAVAHCPKSNAKLGHGTAPLAGFLASGIRVGLGTDSMASNNSCDLFEEARFALLARRLRGDPRESGRPGARELLRLMTLGGAEALGLDGETGSLDVGKQADIIGVKLGGVHQLPACEPETTLLFSTGARDVCLSLVGGEVLYENGMCRTVDEDALRTDLAGAARRIRQHMREDTT